MTYEEMKAEMESIIAGYKRSGVDKLSVLDKHVKMHGFFNKDVEALANAEISQLIRAEELELAKRLKKLYLDNDVPDDLNEMFVKSGYGEMFYKAHGYPILS